MSITLLFKSINISLLSLIIMTAPACLSATNQSEGQTDVNQSQQSNENYYLIILKRITI